MGTVFSIDIRDAGDWSTALNRVVSWLHEVDATFSTYKPESPISRLGRGELSVRACPPEVAWVLGACADLKDRTDGYFSVFAGGQLDPSGYVKGWAIERASEILREHGSENHAVNGGGDTQCAGEAAPGQPWRIGLAHPLQHGRLTAVVSLRDGAVATSGTAERGAHIINPKTGEPATALASVSIIGTGLTRTDGYATAGLAMGLSSLPWLETQDGVEGLIVTATGQARWTTGFPFTPAIDTGSAG